MDIVSEITNFAYILGRKYMHVVGEFEKSKSAVDRTD